MTINFQTVIDQIRGALSHPLPQMFAPHADSTAPFILDEKRYIRKIPEKNYSRLHEYSPISWL